MKQPDPSTHEPFTAKEWLWVVFGVLAACLACMGVKWMATPAESPPAPAPAVAAPVTAEVPPEPLPSTPILSGNVPVNPERAAERTIPHDVAVQAAVRDLRRHSREDPAAPDALSEERIKAIEEKGLLVN